MQVRSLVARDVQGTLIGCVDPGFPTVLDQLIVRNQNYIYLQDQEEFVLKASVDEKSMLQDELAVCVDVQILNAK